MLNDFAVSEALRFGRYALDPERALLSADGCAIALRPKAFDTLHCLLRRAGRVVSKDELAELVWPDQPSATKLLPNASARYERLWARMDRR